jgi:hypothetical protein
MSIHDQLKALDEQKSKLLHDAKTVALETINDAIKSLKSLGFNFNLFEGSNPEGQRRKVTSGIKRTRKDAACPICGFKTAPPHDGRTHRSQSEKNPFTASELKKLNLKKVDGV